MGGMPGLVSLETTQWATVDISGGILDWDYIHAYDTSTITFHGRDFGTMDGLVLEGDRVLGTGVLTGKWADGTPWATTIRGIDAGATIRIVTPEPSTIALLAIGAVGLLHGHARPRK